MDHLKVGSLSKSLSQLWQPYFLPHVGHIHKKTRSNIFHIFRDKNKRFIQWNFFHVTSAPQKLLMQAFPLSVQNHLVSSCHFQRHACFPKNTKYGWFFRQNTSRTTCISHFPFLQNHNKDFQLSDPVICWSWQLQIWSNFFHTLTHLQFYLQYLPPKNVCKILKQIRKKKLEHCCVIPDKVKLASTGRIAPVCSGGVREGASYLFGGKYIFVRVRE